MPAIERDANFLRLWAAETASKAGDAVSLVAVPLTAVVVLGAGPGELATLGAAQLIPVVVFGLPVGAWVDRRPAARPVMVAADALRAMVILSVPAAAAAGALSLWHLWTAVFINACLGTFFDVSIAAYVPRLVGRAQLLAVNARLEASRSAAQVIGPTIAAALIAAFSAPFALVIDGVSFLASSALLVSSRGGESRVRQAPTAPVGRRDEILAGARLAIREPPSDPTPPRVRGCHGGCQSCRPGGFVGAWRSCSRVTMSKPSWPRGAWRSRSGASTRARIATLQQLDDLATAPGGRARSRRSTLRGTRRPRPTRTFAFARTMRPLDLVPGARHGRDWVTGGGMRRGEGDPPARAAIPRSGSRSGQDFGRFALRRDVEQAP